MKKKWVTIFERYEDFHFTKDVGQLPLHVKDILGYDVELWRKSDNNKSVLDKCLSIINVKTKVKTTKISPAIVLKLISNAKEIDVLNAFHFRYYTLIYVLIYKIFNRKGKVVIKCDGSDSIYPIVESKFRTRLLFHIVNKLKVIDLVLAEHESLVTHYSDLGLNTLHCPNGVSSQFYNKKDLPSKSDVPTLIFVGKCGDERKNAEMAINVLVKIQSNFIIYFIGGETDSFREFFKNTISSYNGLTRERFIFKGFITDASIISKLYDKSHIFLMTSIHEGYPLSLAEACWCGCYPVISQGAGGKDLSLAGCATVFSNESELLSVLQTKIDNLSQTEKLGLKSRDYAINNNDWRKKVLQIKEKLFDER